ncbi:Golgi SNAP receptor complex member 1 isoform X2 [Nasonia vitripennis]|uniref:Golgi SNAP receptor complex member 1 n=1 Tax=Nasonia vitripennis TaxID=7425 RepID=A0A7M7TEA8_NASVI|nr:Golgi SNAP receptor complex member 1 isoform X2 [Nasonia vitripennis]XP_032457217.1 Golgi SNAP receptor complex member 1 isoform X2 [Nasonia vitripennis]XP_032457218.1 Golgi SNAP receptor complex member 1 isoform X2 [Nasonia vitripennis]
MQLHSDLRKQARHLENEIDAKLVAFSKLGINMTLSHAPLETVPLLHEDHVFENMSSEIDSLLAKLLLLNGKMNDIHPNGVAMLHTIHRHKEILKDYNLEFRKIINNYVARKNQEELLNEPLIEKGYNNFPGLNRRDMFFKENQHIHNSDKLINDQINIAMEARDHLMAQRYTFKRIQTRFNNLANRVPAVNSLIQRINLRKRRDSVLLGFIIGICTFLILFYSFH